MTSEFRIQFGVLEERVQRGATFGERVWAMEQGGPRAAYRPPRSRRCSGVQAKTFLLLSVILGVSILTRSDLAYKFERDCINFHSQLKVGEQSRLSGE